VFCSAFYIGSSTVHWKDIEKDPHQFFKPASIPKAADIVIKEPSHMTNLCANGLYHFWFNNQEKGRRPLQVLRELRAVHMRGPAPVKHAKTSNVEVYEDEGAAEGHIEHNQHQNGEMAKDRVGTAHLARKKKQPITTAASEESPAGTQHSHQQYLKTLSNSENYQQSLALIKYAVSYILIFLYSLSHYLSEW